MNRIPALLCSILLAASAGWRATAQEADPPADAVEDIVVTARKRAENLRDVPVAITAIGGEVLQQKNITQVIDLPQITPNFSFSYGAVQPFTFIRGFGSGANASFEQSVGKFIDNVSFGRDQDGRIPIFDVERIEVLRGPQGTLYGRNTIGGAIKYVTSRINADEPEGRLRASYGSYNQRDVIASAQLPFSDEFKVSAALARYLRDGYGKNLNTGNEHYNKDVTAFRASAEWSPTDSLFFRLAGDLVNDDSNARHGHREFAPSPADVYDTNAGAGDKNRVESRGVSLLGEWSASDSLTFKSISAYRAGETAGEIDFDTLPAPYLDIPARYSDHQFTQELQLLYSGDRMQAVGGLFYLNATAAGAFDTVLSQAALTIATAGHVDTESWSAFADVSFDLTEALTLSVGGRYTRDEKTGVVYRQNFTGIRSPLFGNPLAVPGLVRSNFTSTDSYEKFTPRVSVSYDLSSELTGYASYSQGFKSGGFDMRADAILTPTSRDGYAPETVDSYEAGLKGYFFDRRLNLNTAVFYAQYQDQQVTLQTPVGASIASQVLNVGESHMSGVELEGVAYLTPDLSANFALGYIKAEFDEYRALNPLTGVVEDFADSRVFQNTPEWTGAFSLTYQRDLGDKGKISFIPSAAYRSSFSMFEIPSRLDQGAYWLYDASLVWTSESERYRVGLHGKNLGDETYRIGGYNFPGGLFANSITAYYGPPQTVTLSLEAKF